MRLPGASSWAVKKKRGVRAGSSQARGLVSVGSVAVPGAPAYAKVLTGDAVKDFYRRAVGPVSVLETTVFELAGVPASSKPLHLYYVHNHRKELDACSRHLSRYLAVVFFAACSGWPMAPAEEWRQYRLVNQDSSDRAKLETQCFFNDDRTGICTISSVIRACPGRARSGRLPGRRKPQRASRCHLPERLRAAAAAALHAHLAFSARRRRGAVVSAPVSRERARSSVLLHDLPALTPCTLPAPLSGAINNALHIVLTPAEILAIFPEKLNSNGLQSIDKGALKAALDAHGVTVEPLRRIFERVYRSEYEQRVAEISIICGQAVDLKARLKAIRQGKRVEKLERKPETRKRASGRRKPKPKAARSARQPRVAPPPQLAAPQPAAEAEESEDDGTDGEEEDDSGYATEEDSAFAAAPAASVTDEMAEDGGWCLALLNAEASLLPKAEGDVMRHLIEFLELRPLFDTHICGITAPDFIKPPFLRKRGREAQLQQQQAAAAALAASEVAGAREVAFEVTYTPPGAASRVLFACIGEVLLAEDCCGERHANLSYAEGDRTVLPDGIPRSVPSAIFRACMLTMVAKLLRAGAAQLWLTACSPDWQWCEKTRSIYPDHYLVASRGKQYSIAVPGSAKLSAKQAEAAAMRFAAKQKQKQDDVLVNTVYPTLFAHGEMHGLLAAGSGKWVAAPGAGAAVPPFVDDVFSKRLLCPSSADHKPVPAGAFQLSFLDAELAQSNKAAQMFWARLSAPDELSRLATQLAMSLDRTLPVALAKHYKWRASEFENIKNRALRETEPLETKDFQTLGQLARFKIRDKYLEMQTNPLNF